MLEQGQGTVALIKATVYSSLINVHEKSRCTLSRYGYELQRRSKRQDTKHHKSFTEL